MALVKFKAPALPLPSFQYDQGQQEQLIRALRLYFNQLDSLTPNQADSYRADHFYGGDFTGNFDGGTVDADSFTGGNFTGDYATFLALTVPIIYGSLVGGNVQANAVTASKVNSSLFTGLGAEITLPHIGASDSTDQYAGGNDTPTKVAWNTLDTSYGFTLASNQATAAYDGVYKIDYSLQFVNTDNAQNDVFVWLQVNGSNVAGSTTQFTVPARKSAGVYGYLCAYSTITFSVNAGDVFALYWATPTAYNTTGPVDGVYMEYIASQSSPYARPSIPSAIGAITYMSAPQPPLTRVAPVGIVGVGGVGTPTISITR